MLGRVLSAIGVSMSVVVDGDEQVCVSAAGAVVDDAALVPDAGLGLPAVAAHQAALPGSDVGHALSTVHDTSNSIWEFGPTVEEPPRGWAADSNIVDTNEVSTNG